MNHAVRATTIAVALSCAACYGASVDDDEESTGGAGPSTGSGKGGGPGSGGGGATGGSSRGGSSVGGSSVGGSSAGGVSTGGAPACNDLQIIPLNPICGALIPAPTPTGGVIPNGVYGMSEYYADSCLSIEETVRITATFANTYDLELAIDLIETRFNAQLVTSGTTMTSTITCGGDSVEPGEPASYSVLFDPPRFVISNSTSVSVFLRVGD